MHQGWKVLRRLGVYCLLMLLNVPLATELVPPRFPLRGLSSVYLLTLCICLIFYDSYRVSRQGGVRTMMLAISWMALLLIAIRGVKYTILRGLEIPSRYGWYAYYIPILLIPLFLFYISLLVSETEERHIPKKWYWTLGVTAALALLVLTNDLHQQCFRFRSGMESWETDYAYGWGFYAVYAWQYSLYLSAVFVLAEKCRVSSSKKSAWLTLLPFALGTGVILLINQDAMPTLNGTLLIQFPEALAFMAAGMLDVCMQLGLIPTNEKYGKLFRISSLSAQITDCSGKPVYRSATAATLTAEQLAAPSGTRIAPHTVLHRMDLPGGYGFWQSDVAELDELNRRLEDAREQLSEEAELIRLQNELQEKQAKLEQRTLVYDDIARRVQAQSQTISRLCAQARGSADEALRDRNRKEIMLLGAYIKRYANLTLIGAETGSVPAGEFALSVSEMLRYLNLYGIAGDIRSSAGGSLSADGAILAFELFENLLEGSLPTLRGVTVKLTEHPGGVSCKLILESFSAPPPGDMADRLSSAGVRMKAEQEGDTAYLELLLPKGGDAQ